MLFTCSIFDVTCFIRVVYDLKNKPQFAKKTRNIILFSANAIDMLLGWLKEYVTYKNSLPFVLKGFLLGHEL